MLDYLLSFEGRTGRGGYFAFGLVWILIWVAYFIGPFFLAAYISLPDLGFIGFFLLLLGMVVSSFAVTVRRLHDLDLSGWVILVMILLGILNAGLMFYREFLFEAAQIFQISTVMFLLSLFLHCFYVLLLVWPGSEGINRYG
ncbi:MAG: DUF805 domain-containing protein [Alphaproteobacteria bacterium]|nr:DUF805 domain-containing protein [Alphaproteobacteria bacterium]